MDKQPTALRLADELVFTGRFAHETEYQAGIRRIIRNETAAAELRRLHQVNQELAGALKEIAEWTERYTSAGHPISTVARAALAKHREQA